MKGNMHYMGCCECQLATCTGSNADTCAHAHQLTLQSICSEQLNTQTMMPRARPKSLVVSVLPVPAGPAGAPLMVRCRDWVRVMQHLNIVEIQRHGSLLSQQQKSWLMTDSADCSSIYKDQDKATSLHSFTVRTLTTQANLQLCYIYIVGIYQHCVLKKSRLWVQFLALAFWAFLWSLKCATRLIIDFFLE